MLGLMFLAVGVTLGPDGNDFGGEQQEGFLEVFLACFINSCPNGLEMGL